MGARLVVQGRVQLFLLATALVVGLVSVGVIVGRATGPGPEAADYSLSRRSFSVNTRCVTTRDRRVPYRLSMTLSWRSAWKSPPESGDRIAFGLGWPADEWAWIAARTPQLRAGFSLPRTNFLSGRVANIWAHRQKTTSARRNTALITDPDDQAEGSWSLEFDSVEGRRM